MFSVSSGGVFDVCLSTLPPVEQEKQTFYSHLPHSCEDAFGKHAACFSCTLLSNLRPYYFMIYLWLLGCVRCQSGSCGTLGTFRNVW